MNSYREELGQDAQSYLEILTSLDLFYGTSYDHYKNENMERLTQASTELARRSTILAEKSMTFTKLVFFLTISGIILAIADLSLTHWESSSLLFTVVLVVILLLACGGYLYYPRFGNEKETIKDESSSGDDSLSLSQYVGTIGIVVLVPAFIINWYYGTFTGIQTVVLIIASIVMVMPLVYRPK